MGLEPKLPWGRKAQEIESKLYHRVRKFHPSQVLLERAIIEGDSPVGERAESLLAFLSTTGHEESCGKLG